jgi:hypothetical protein
MQVVYNDKNITIVDNFLDNDTLAKVRDQSECLKMKKLELGDDKVYKMNVGDIYKSENKYWSNKRPWNNNFEPFMEALIEFVDNCKTCLPEKQFEKISCMLHVYLSGSELSWHRDGALGGGAYSFYIHNEWRHTWGGNLLVADSSTKVTSINPLPGTSMEDMIGKQYNVRSRTWNLDDESGMIMNPGYGRYFAPLPNRLMITTGEVVHKVERVDQSAGENSRRSLTGFFA